MKKFFIVYPFLKEYYIIKVLQRHGYEVLALDLYDKNLDIIKRHKRLELFFKEKSLTRNEIFNTEKNFQYLALVNNKKTNFIDSLERISFKDLPIDSKDLISFDEDLLFPCSVIGGSFLSQRDAFTYSCKHIVYKKLKKSYFKIRKIEDFKNIPDGKYILKPSLNSCGKKNVFILHNNKDYQKIIEQDNQLFSINRVFIVEKYIEHVNEIWAMTLFDKDGNPYILWFSTEKNHSTFSVFEEDFYKNIKILNEKLKIKNWMAYIQFLLDENGNLHFIDLNPRLPGDDDWHELLYRYMTGRSFAKTIVELIIDHRAPDIIKTNRYVKEEEYNPKVPLKKNQRMWDYPDNYKEKPLLTFKKLDLWLNIR
jgi:hypothetical protein